MHACTATTCIIAEGGPKKRFFLEIKPRKLLLYHAPNIDSAKVRAINY